MQLQSLFGGPQNCHLLLGADEVEVNDSSKRVGSSGHAAFAPPSSPFRASKQSRLKIGNVSSGTSQHKQCGMEKQSVCPQSVSRWQLLPAPALCCKPNPPVHPPRHCWRWTLSSPPKGREPHKGLNPTDCSQGLVHGLRGKGHSGVPVDAPTLGRTLHRCTLLLQNSTLWTFLRFHFCPVPGGTKPAHPEPQKLFLRGERQEKRRT